ncbi:hypothetical protein ACOMHN_026731 [Nucella lapillus]
MTSRRETGTSPMVLLTDEEQTSSSQTELQHTSPALSETEDRLPLEGLNEEQDSSVINWSYTPSSTPVKPYPFSEHIHKDRHIFLKGASLGIGCGTSATSAPPDVPVSVPDWTPRVPVRQQQDYFVDEKGNVFCNGQYLGMALDDERLPVLHRVQLALPSANWSRQRSQERFPHVHLQHQLPEIRRRPFNEQLNTYVDTQKRIRSVQCLDDLYRSSPFPVFPYLSTPSPRRPRPPPPPPAKIRAPGPRSTPPLSLSPRVVKRPTRPVVGKTAFSDPGVTGSQNADVELAQARQVMQELQQASSNQNYADYFLGREGRQGTLGRLFESYPKRMLVHPGRLLRQRSDIVYRARQNTLK